MNTQIIEIATEYGKRKMEAVMCGQWAVHNSTDTYDAWTITHIETGYALIDCTARHVAINFAVFIDDLYDWNGLAKRALEECLNDSDMEIVKYIKTKSNHPAMVKRGKWKKAA